MSQAGALVNQSGPGPFLETLKGNTGGAVGPDGSGNINVVGDAITMTIAGNPGTHTLTGSVINGGFTWSDKAVTFDANIQNGYFCTGNLTVNLPPNTTFTNALVSGSTIIVYVDGAVTVIIQCSGTQRIQVGDSISAAGGNATSSPVVGGSTLTLVYRLSDNTWHSQSVVGNFPVT